MARIYTRGGDRGETSLGDGSRAPKSGPRVDLYGEIDELISWIGAAAVQLAQPDDAPVAGAARFAALERELTGIQDRLFEMSSIVADPGRSQRVESGQEAAPALDAAPLERAIDAMTEALPPLTEFILPGGTPAAATLHLARTACRRVERKAVALATAEPVREPVPEAALVYLNRLSDYLFTAARAANLAAGVPDRRWRRHEGADS